ncbi:hypothetical protein KIN20_016681 [Parelaphostrongylus tenuis]|uniref:Uncharacterized protein n=1 Tax=Parelaphostrongylus tenuis TaxID=148309 RepID=A0AAD5QQW3_PARTN|nr:hypothetical protein KIN20_016681 [Parelaphostrongylus tenuis]
MFHSDISEVSTVITEQYWATSLHVYKKQFNRRARFIAHNTIISTQLCASDPNTRKK